MVDIRPNALPDAILPLRTGDELIVDQGADGVRKVDPFALTDSTAPVATQTEAQVGADNAKRMTPLRTKQSIASEVGVTLASNTQGAKADSAVQSVNGKSGNSVTLVKGDVGLGNVDNTSDADKPISTATQNALNDKAPYNKGIPDGGTTGQVLAKSSNLNDDVAWTDAGTGDMLKSVYDTTNKNADAFNRANHYGAVIPDNGSVTDQKVATPTDPTQGIDAAKLTFSFEFASGQFRRSSLFKAIRDEGYNLKTMFPVAGDGATDDTIGLEQAVAKCRADNRPLIVPAGMYKFAPRGGNKYALNTQGISILGEGSKYSIFAPYRPFADDEDYFLMNVAAGQMNDFIDIDGISLQPSQTFSTGVTGKRGLWVVINVANINVGKLRIQRCYFFPTKDLSLHIENNAALLPQGCPSNSMICDNAFWGGVKMTGIGDSNEFLRNIVRTQVNTVPTPGIECTVTDNGIGSAGHNAIVGNNIDCSGGGILLHNGRHWQILRNNIEQSTGQGTSIGAVIDLRGDVGRLDMPVVTDNVSAIFGTSIAARALAIGNADRAYVDGNKFDSDSPRNQAVWNRVGAVGSIFGYRNRLTSAWATKFTDEGTGTRQITTSAGYTPA